MTVRELLKNDVYGAPPLRSAPIPAGILPFSIEQRPEGDASGLSQHSISRRFSKRAFDLVAATLLLALCSPLLASIALLVRIDSHGPVFFRQQRIGQGGRLFDIVKFRTMYVLENGDDVVQVRKGDLRVTRVGRWLRRTSFDELPQLINVIRGEMSLVGPRPHAVVHDRHYATLIENYVLRQKVKPGITGWAQVNGFRGATPTLEAMQARVLYDVWYARHACFAFDLRILLRTPFEIIRRRNAY